MNKSLKKIGFAVICLIPLTFLIIALGMFQVNVPYDDEWRIMPEIMRFFEKGFSINDLWAPINEHRPVIVKLINYPAIRITSWNNYPLNLIGVFFSLLIYILLAREMKKIFRSENITDIWPYIAVSIMVFSLNQFEIWLSVFGWPYAGSLLFLILGLREIFTSRIVGLKHVILSLFFGILSTLTFGYGLLYWPLAALSLLFRRIWTGFVFVFLLSIPLIITYQSGIKSPQGWVSFYPEDLLLYFLLALGRPLGSLIYYRQELSIALGTAGIAVFYVLLRLNEKKNVVLPFILLLSTVSLSTILISAISRSGMGYEQAHSSRYITASSFFWYAVIIMYPIAVKSHKSIILRRIVPVLFIVYVSLVSVRGLREMKAMTDIFMKGRISILENNQSLYDYVKIRNSDYLQAKQFLIKYGLSLYYK